MRAAFALALVVLAAPGVRAASLDVTAAYKLQSLVYRGLEPGGPVDDHSLTTDDARLGIAARRIELPDPNGATMDVVLRLRSLGVAGSTTALASPFDRASSYYPSVDGTPFIENADLSVRGLWGLPLVMTFGRQNFRLGSGLLLDDDGAGLTGAVVRGELPWGGLKAEGFAFEDKDPQASGPNSLGLFGLSIDMPTEGTWQLNELLERERGDQLVYGCSYAGMPGGADGCLASKALRSFTSVRYQISYGPLVFDGEAAMEKGVATPTAQPGDTPAPNHITYDADAEVVKMKWKQSLYHVGQGIARVSVARGSGDDASTPTRDEAFYPAHGHRFDGLERSGFGDFYSATPYDAYGGNYSTTTKSGLPLGVSGIMVVGAGFTPPAYRGFALDVDYFLYQAQRVASGSRTLGSEWDFRLRYPVRDELVLSAGMAYFKAGLATDGGRHVARQFSLEASGRF
jgi:hypothetical protein